MGVRGIVRRSRKVSGVVLCCVTFHRVARSFRLSISFGFGFDQDLSEWLPCQLFRAIKSIEHNRTLTPSPFLDNAHLEVFLRGDLAGQVDYSRVAIMRTASDFDRAPPDETEVYHLLYADQQGFEPSIENIFIAGHAIVEDVLGKWSGVYEKGIKSENYLGDLFDSLGGKIKPDIG